MHDSACNFKKYKLNMEDWTKNSLFLNTIHQFQIIGARILEKLDIQSAFLREYVSK